MLKYKNVSRAPLSMLQYHLLTKTLHFLFILRAALPPLTKYKNLNGRYIYIFIELCRNINIYICIIFNLHRQLNVIIDLVLVLFTLESVWELKKPKIIKKRRTWRLMTPKRFEFKLGCKVSACLPWKVFCIRPCLV